MKTRLLLAAVLIALCTPAFAQFRGPHRHHHGHIAPYSYRHFDPYVGPFGPIEYRWGHYYDQYGDIVSPDYLGISLYGSEYLIARRQTAWGSALTLTGAGMVLASVLGAAIESDFNRSFGNGPYYGTSGVSSLNILTGLVGAACLGTGIPLWVSGNRRFYRIADDYNMRYGRGGIGQAPSLSVEPTASGIGLALRF